MIHKILRGVLRTAVEIVLLGPSGPLVTRVWHHLVFDNVVKFVNAAQANELAKVFPSNHVAIVAAILASIKTYNIWLYRRRCSIAASQKAWYHMTQEMLDCLLRCYKVPMFVYDRTRLNENSLDWFNDTLRFMWPYVSRCVKSIIAEVVQPILAKQSDAFSLQFTQFTLGTRAPVIESLSTSLIRDETQNDTLDALGLIGGLKILCDIRWEGDPDILFRAAGAALGDVGITVEAVNLVIKGQLEIIIRPFVESDTDQRGYIDPKCHASGISIMFITDPYIKYDVRVKTGSKSDFKLASIPGLNTYVLSILGSLLADILVFPKNIVIPITDTLAKTAEEIIDILKVKPIGELYFTVNKASNLIGMDIGKKYSDPYACVGLISKSKGRNFTIISKKKASLVTRVIKNVPNPVWNETCLLRFHDPQKEIVGVRIYDEDFGSNDDFLGLVDIPLHYLVNSDTNSKNKTEATFTLRGLDGNQNNSEGVPYGEVTVSFRWEKINENSHASTSSSLEQNQNSGAISQTPRLAPKVSYTRTVERLVQKMLEQDSNEKKCRYLQHLVKAVIESEHLPYWITEPTYDSFRWGNILLGWVWPYLNMILKEEVQIIRESGLLSVAPGLVLDIKNFDIGSWPPVLSGIRFNQNSMGVASLDLVVRYQGNVNINVGMKTLSEVSRMSINVDYVSFYTTVRVNIGPLLPILPLVAAISIQFLAMPVVDFSAVVKLSPFLPSFDVNSFPVTRAILQRALGAIFRCTLLKPRGITLPLVDFNHPGISRYLLASDRLKVHSSDETQDSHHTTGTYSVRIKAARDLLGKGKVSNKSYYAVISVENIMKLKERDEATYKARNFTTQSVKGSDVSWDDSKEQKCIADKLENIMTVIAVFCESKLSSISASSFKMSSKKGSSLAHVNSVGYVEAKRRAMAKYTDRISESLRSARLLEASSFTDISTIHFSPMVKQSMEMMQKYMEIREKTLQKRRNTDALPKRKKVALGENKVEFEKHHVVAEGPNKKVMSKISLTSLEEMVDFECVEKGNSLIGALVLTGPALVHLLETHKPGHLEDKSKPIKSLKNIWLPIEGKSDAKVLLEFEWKPHNLSIESVETKEKNVATNRTSTDKSSEIASPPILKAPSSDRSDRRESLTESRRGSLFVHVLRAKNLAISHSLMRRFVTEGNKLSPMVEVNFGGQTKETSCSKGASPEFDVTIEFIDVQLSPGDPGLIKVVVNHDFRKLFDKQPLGHVNIYLDSLLQAANELDGKFSLKEARHGDIYLSLKWQPH